MTTRVVHEWHIAGVNAVLSGPSGGLARDLLRRGLRVQSLAKQKVRADHGRLRNSINLRLQTGDFLYGAYIKVEVGTDVKYAIWVHNGTGIYGKHRSPIVPVHGRYMTFIPKGSRTRIYVRSVRGQTPNPFLKDAIVAAVG
jgi:hypothetical protein